MFALLPLGGLAAAAGRRPVRAVALRVRRHTFVVITIAIFFIFQLAAFNLTFTGGTAGCNAPIPLWDPAATTSPSTTSRSRSLLATVALSWLIRRSRFGLQLRAIRDDEDRARGLGVRTMPRQAHRVRASRRSTSGWSAALWVYFIGQV